jgi:hypothetical protein
MMGGASLGWIDIEHRLSIIEARRWSDVTWVVSQTQQQTLR